VPRPSGRTHLVAITRPPSTGFPSSYPLRSRRKRSTRIHSSLGGVFTEAEARMSLDNDRTHRPSHGLSLCRFKGPRYERQSISRGLSEDAAETRSLNKHRPLSFRNVEVQIARRQGQDLKCIYDLSTSSSRERRRLPRLSKLPRITTRVL
jgi:hypothetical protein